MCKLVISRGTRVGQPGNFFQCDTICIGTGQRIKQWLVWATSYQFKVVFTGMYKSGSNIFPRREILSMAGWGVFFLYTRRARSDVLCLVGGTGDGQHRSSHWGFIGCYCDHAEVHLYQSLTLDK